MIQVEKVKWCMKQIQFKDLLFNTCLLSRVGHQTCKPVMVSVVNYNFIFLQPNANYAQKCYKCQICLIYENLDSAHPFLPPHIYLQIIYSEFFFPSTKMCACQHFWTTMLHKYQNYWLLIQSAVHQWMTSHSICCPPMNDFSFNLLSTNEWLLIQSAVHQWMTSHAICCPPMNDFSCNLLSTNEWLLIQSAVHQWMTSHSICCPPMNDFSFNLLSTNEWLLIQSAVHQWMTSHSICCPPMNDFSCNLLSTNEWLLIQSAVHQWMTSHSKARVQNLPF